MKGMMGNKQQEEEKRHTFLAMVCTYVSHIHHHLNSQRIIITTIVSYNFKRILRSTSGTFYTWTEHKNKIHCHFFYSLSGIKILFFPLLSLWTKDVFSYFLFHSILFSPQPPSFFLFFLFSCVMCMGWVLCQVRVPITIFSSEQNACNASNAFIRSIAGYVIHT